ncbi:MAG: SDR family oxidoreductase [Aphanocapsa lilacina HA4352-LM1]|jgi:NAD(P)-dependent dehydrogenase (short-subunit alcohol dehydrogenase family)|nr:SDR family oxidoreductase [Aphanocapsa lilacina HA4352-LM1]
MGRLQGKRTLITGGTTGIGQETARQFLAEGARVAITGNNPDTLAQAKQELGDAVLVIRSDAGQVEAQKHLADELARTFEKLDAVFLNAGIGVFQPLEAWDEAAFDKQIAVNLKGPFFLIQHLLPVLANPASIVLNTSINAHIGMPASSVYGASKAGMISLARTLSGELVDRGIRVNAISPGPVSTPVYGKLGFPPEQAEQMVEALRNQIALKRFADPVEIAKAVVFLASDESSFMLGSEIIVDGGMSTL